MEIKHFDREIEEELTRIMAAHERWLGAWRRAVLCGAAAEDGHEPDCCGAFRRLGGLFRVVDGHSPQLAVMHAHDEIHQLGDQLHQQGAPLATRDYDRFDALNAAFAEQVSDVRHNFAGDGARLVPRAEMRRRLSEEHQRIIRSRACATLLLAQLSGLPAGEAGQAVAARVLGWVARALRPYDLVFPLTDDQCLACVAGINAAMADPVIRRLREAVGELLAHDDLPGAAGLQLQFVSAELEPQLTLDQCLARLRERLDEAATAR